MAELTIDRIYASALYDAAAETGNTKKVGEDLDGIRQTMETEPLLERVLCSPAVDVEEKKNIFGELFRGKVEKETLNFLYILADKSRGGQFRKIVKAYHILEEEAEGFVCGRVYSVNGLSKEQLEAIEAKIGKIIGKRVSLENLTEKSLIGGLKVEVDGKLFDASIRSRIEALQHKLAQEGTI